MKIDGPTAATIRDLAADLVHVQTRAEAGEDVWQLIAEVDSLVAVIHAAIRRWFRRRKLVGAVC